MWTPFQPDFQLVGDWTVNEEVIVCVFGVSAEFAMHYSYWAAAMSEHAKCFVEGAMQKALWEMR